MTAFQTIVENLDNLSTEELRSLNVLVVNKIRFASAQKNQIASAQFSPGDVVEFYSKKKGCSIRIKVSGYNRARTSLTGTQLVPSNQPFLKWTVSAVLCEKIG